MAWGVTQRQSIERIEQQSSLLRERITLLVASGGDGSVAGAQAESSKPGGGKGRPDWKKISAQFADLNDGGVGDMRAMMRLQAQLHDMTAEELLEAIDEVARLEVADEVKARIEQMIIGPLLEKEPELGLTRFIDRIFDERYGAAWQLSHGLSQWAIKEPGKASAWFDQQIAAGRFESKSLDGKSQARIQFEGSMISVLLASDPDAAARRLEAMPEDQRQEVLQNHSFQSLKEKDHVAFAALVRSHLPKDEQPAAISQQASRLVSLGGYEQVTAFLDRIDATTDERTKTVENAAESKIQTLGYKGGVTREEIESMRAWVSAQAPGSTETVTGRALASSMQSPQGMKFPEAAALVRGYSEASGSDEGIASFLEHHGALATDQREAARELAASISDGKRRERILKRLE